ncbi:hypothetical protein OG874_24420 [Nocardia sp. NBC_00565]|uniref:hypothetical protein n=1 Tax=Nocardia sp. NBC_00565 TaxID=2975993 RepID=UPI002E800D20|nr:hypothetical protein [Nocardia sp. NBC_00565]WUC00051.1 hypothetical protein OG874_24420 [Nocardia sp. NBC_00565]
MLHHYHHKIRNRICSGPDVPCVSQFDWICFRRRGNFMIPVIIDTGSAALNGLFSTGSAAFHGIFNTLWTGSFGG